MVSCVTPFSIADADEHSGRTIELSICKGQVTGNGSNEQWASFSACGSHSVLESVQIENVSGVNCKSSRSGKYIGLIRTRTEHGVSTPR